MPDVCSRVCVGVGIACWATAALLWTRTSGETQVLAQAVPVAAASTTPVWAGYVLTHGGPFTSVQASWRVAKTTCSKISVQPSTTFTWIGEGGYVRGLASPLIQAGTSADCIAGHTQYHAFYEWYPGSYVSYFPIVLAEGDTVMVRLTEVRSDYWLLSVDDLTSNQHSVTATFFRADTASADFIAERPTLCNVRGCGQMPLARFEPIVFRDLHIVNESGDSIGTKDATAIALSDSTSQHLLAIPARTTSGQSPSILWRRAT